MFKTIALTVAVVLVLFIAVVLALAARKPDTFRVQRQAVIEAPAARIFPLINDYRQWAAWSPYEKKDPAMTRRYAGPASGPGARYAWDSQEVGTGDMVITEATPGRAVRMDLNFSKPFEAHNQVVFSLQPQGDGGATQVTWDMHGPAPLMSRVMQVFFDMDRMVGKDFAAGLADLKAVAEKKPAA